MEKFRKSERLCSRKAIEKLFSTGKGFYHYPFRILWTESSIDDSHPVRIAVSVPRKRIRKAVDRNRIKRLIRESYRLNKNIIRQSLLKHNMKIDMMVIYISNDILDYNTINANFREMLRRFTENILKDK